MKITDWLKFKADANMNYYYNRGDNKELGTGYANDGGYYKIWQTQRNKPLLVARLLGTKL